MSGAISPSPRPSVSIRSPASSSRTSLDQPASATNSISRAGNTRKNRAALRDYYNIKSNDSTAQNAEAQSVASPRFALPDSQTVLSELDREGFDAGDYVRKLLERDRLEDILKIENELVGEIRGLDGDRKALVYDNYSKLISATDTIKKMRTNMDPLTPTTSTLAPAISHIAEMATTLSNELTNHVPEHSGPNLAQQQRERQTVQWVLDAPDRLEQLLLDDKKQDALEDWASIKLLLDAWNGVKGTDAVRAACEKALGAVD